MTLADVESVFANRVVILPDKDNSAEEQRFRAIERTAGKRAAFIVFTMRLQTGQRIRRSARDLCTRRRSRLMKKPIPTFRAVSDQSVSYPQALK